MYKSLILISSVMLFLNCSAETCSDIDLRDFRGCQGETFTKYYLAAYGYQSALGSTSNGHSTWCYGYQACKDTIMTYGSGNRCYAYQSCQNAVMTAVYANCEGTQSCLFATITQTINSHRVACIGRQSCYYASIYGPEGLYVDFTGFEVREMLLYSY